MEAEEYILSFDVGIQNLAYSVVRVERNMEKLKKLPAEEFCDRVLTDKYLTIVHSQHVDLNHSPFVHEQVSEKECELSHGKLICDKVDHFLQEFRPMATGFGLTTCLVEVQPITGITSVEAFLHQEFRDILERISPNSVHAWLGTTKLTTYFRKDKITSLTRKALIPFLRPRVEEQHQCDSLVLILFHLYKRLQTR